MVHISWRTGVNMREFAYYGTDVIDPNDPANNPGLQEIQLAALKAMKVKLVRFYASHHRFDTTQSIARIRAAVEKIGKAGMQAIICLDDSVRDSGCFVKGNDTQFIGAGPIGHYDKRYYVEKLYTTHYMNHIEAVVSALKNDPAILIWELSNEAALHPQKPGQSPNKADFEAYCEYVRVASTKIKTISPKHLVSLGLASVRHVISFVDGDAEAHAQAKKLYGLPTVDLISIHYYEEDGVQEAKWREDFDLATAKAVGKGYYLGEIGANRHTIDRVTYHRTQIDHWKNLGAFAALPWQFNALRNDLRISDGMAKMHGDFDGLVEMLTAFGTDAAPVIISGEDASLIGIGIGEDATLREYRVNIPNQPLFGAPEASAPQIAQDLKVDTVLQADPNSRREKDGKIWWRVSGWVVERETTVAENAPDALLHFIAPPRKKIKFRVIFAGDIFLRSDPSRPSNNSNVIGEVRTNNTIEVYEDTRTVTADGWVWWQHDDGHVEDQPTQKIAGGWSAESGGGKTFLERVAVDESGGNPIIQVERFFQNPDEMELDVNALPLRDSMFSRIPTDWPKCWLLQHYGNTKESFDSCRYRTFFQGLHSGIDIGSLKAHRKSGILEVHAGVTGVVEDLITTSYAPFGVRVRVGNYQIIYGHMAGNDRGLKKDDLVTPETVLGHIANDDELAAYNVDKPPAKQVVFWPHLHLEIRYLPLNPDRILNPYMFFPPTLRQLLVKGWQAKHFFNDAAVWTEWTTPFEQPVIKFQGGLAGPLSRSSGHCK